MRGDPPIGRIRRVDRRADPTSETESPDDDRDTKTNPAAPAAPVPTTTSTAAPAPVHAAEDGDHANEDVEGAPDHANEDKGHEAPEPEPRED